MKSLYARRAKNRSSLLICALCLALTFSACGKRRPPQPPVERVPQRTELLSGVQRGNQVILSWPAPRRNASDESVQSIRRVDVYRLAEAVDDPLPLTEEEFSARANLIGSVTSEQIEGATDTLAYTDELTLSEPVRLRYSVRYVNAAGQRASFSNFLLIEPAAGVSQPPVIGQTPSVSENAIIVRWEAPVANVDNTRPANLLGYNVYRSARSQNEPAQTPLNSRPVNALSFADQTFAFGEEYVYVVRAVSLGTGGEPVESLNSNQAEVKPADTFKPAPPEGLTVAAVPSPLRISIFFAANQEPDIAGYNLYRSNDPDLPKEQWTKLNHNLLERTTYQDEAVKSGQRYFYYVTAVDKAGNVSNPSDVRSDIVP
ncbi:MAG: fibronectin type III domain-containing protein [Pyrinomonadaceae bacterium]